MTAVNQCTENFTSLSGARLMKWILIALSISLLLYLVWIVCGIGCGLFSFAVGLA